MKKLAVTASIIALSAGMAQAGGIDRSGQSVGIIFEEGSVLELSFGSVSPSLSGTYVGGALASGQIGVNYTQVAFGFKHQINDKLSLSLIADQPFGATVDYPSTATFATLAGTNAEFKSQALTALARYQFSDRVSVHGGIKGEWVEMNVSVPAGGALAYSATGAKDFEAGYVIGAAYEIPDIALRVALTYSSEVEHSISTTESSVATGGATITSPDTVIKMPQSVNLDFQSGVAANTLVFGSIRWVDWTSTNISPSHYTTTLGQSALLNYSEDRITYNLGVGRKFSDSWAGSVSLSHEANQGNTTGNLGPTDGFTSVSVGGSYTTGQHKISGGVRRVWVGDATSSGAGGFNGTFSGNTAWAFGMKYSYSF